MENKMKLKKLIPFKKLDLLDFNKKEEYVRLRARLDVNLREYAIVDKTYDKDGNVSNKFRHIYRFPDVTVKMGEFIRLHSGKGRYHRQDNSNNTVTHHFYWNADENIWNDGGDEVTLIKYEVISKKVA